MQNALAWNDGTQVSELQEARL